jgi:hypothetical protein
MPHFFPLENKKLFLYYHCCLLLFPYSLGFTLFLVHQSLSSPYFLDLYFILSLFYPPIYTLSPLYWPYFLDLYFTLSLSYPPIYTLFPKPLLHFIFILPPYLNLIPLVLTLFPRPLFQFFFILPRYLYHIPCIFTPLLLDLCIFSLCSLNFSSLIHH